MCVEQLVSLWVLLSEDLRPSGPKCEGVGKVKKREYLKVSFLESGACKWKQETTRLPIHT